MKHPGEKVKRTCPNCNKLYLISRDNENRAIRNNTVCKSCSKLGRRNPLYGVPCKDKEAKRRQMLGNKHNLNKIRTPEQKKIHSVKMREYNKTEAGRDTIERRTKTLREIRKKYGITGFKPNFNREACKFFDYLNLSCNWHGTHALNGGEHYIPELGYWVDYYNREQNIVIEWDEKQHHFQGNSRVQSDIIRENAITQFLRCKFIRLIESNTTNYEQTKNFILDILAQRGERIE